MGNYKYLPEEGGSVRSAARNILKVFSHELAHRFSTKIGTEGSPGFATHI